MLTVQTADIQLRAKNLRLCLCPTVLTTPQATSKSDRNQTHNPLRDGHTGGQFLQYMNTHKVMWHHVTKKTISFWCKKGLNAAEAWWVKVHLSD